MPYIKQEDRITLQPVVDEINTWPAFNAGELNYLFTILAHSYIKSHGLSYQRVNDVIGALEGAKLEFYRRKAAEYEDEKAKQNGDV